MNNNIKIRPIRAGDRMAWETLWRDYLKFYDTELPGEIYDATFTRYSDPEFLQMCGWMAWDDETPLGLVHSIAHQHGWRIEDVTYLQDLFTVPAARGKGVARALIETVYEDADASGRANVYWLTQTGNDAARRLYDRIAKPTDFMVYRRNVN